MSALAPSVMPRPKKALALTTTASPTNGLRGGRTYSPSVSPIKVCAPSPSSKQDAVLAAEPTLSAPQTYRHKPLVVPGGDIRNLDSNFQLATSRVQVTLAEVTSVMASHDVSLTPDDAKTLLHEYEENNDQRLGYDAFVRELVQLQRHKKKATGSARVQLKKTRLALHVRLLAEAQARRLDELKQVLRDRLRTSWSDVRAAFRQLDASHKGVLSTGDFARVCAQLQIPVTDLLLDALVLTMDADADGVVDYNEFLAHFGPSFQHGDTNSVSHTLVYTTPSAPKPSAASPSPIKKHPLIHNTSANTAQVTADADADAHLDPEYLEKLRIVLNDKIAARYPDVKKAFMAVDRDGNGVISGSEFSSVLSHFNLMLSPTDTRMLMASFDTNHDGNIDYHEFFAKFGDVLKPSASLHTQQLGKTTLADTNASLVFGQSNRSTSAGGGSHEHHHDSSVSASSELKDAFSSLSDADWRAIFVELQMSDPRQSGLVPSAELLRVLAKFVGDLPRRHFHVLFRTCGNHGHELMNYRMLVKSYRARVMDTAAFLHADVHAQAEKTYKKSPTEALVMVWALRVQRAQMSADAWSALKQEIWALDTQRHGRVVAAAFSAAVRTHMRASEDQAAFLCFFYEDKNLTADHVLIRYGSFFNDYEDPRIEAGDAPPSSSSTATNNPPRTPTIGGGGASHSMGNSSSGAKPTPSADDSALREFFQTHVRSLESMFQGADADRKGSVRLATFQTICKELLSTMAPSLLNQFKNRQVAHTFLAKYVAGQAFDYRTFLLDFDTSVGLQAQPLSVRDADLVDLDSVDADGTLRPLDVATASTLLRSHLTASVQRQKAVYRLFQSLDAAKTGLLSSVEIRRVLEKLSIRVDDATGREWWRIYEDDESDCIKYPLWLHAHGGRDPDSLSALSDLSSHCSYYSAVSISPRAVGPSRTGMVPARTRPHEFAATVVQHAVAHPRHTSSTSSSNSVAALEQRIKSELDAVGKTTWRQLARNLQQLDTEHRGDVAVAALQKVLAQLGVTLSQEDLVRLQLKYDVAQTGRVQYHALLRTLTTGLSDPRHGSSSVDADQVLPALPSPTSAKQKKRAGMVSEPLRTGVRTQWKALYASLKTLDKANVGRVPGGTLRQLLDWYGLAVSDDTMLELLRGFDHADDGWVDYNKFMRACLDS